MRLKNKNDFIPDAREHAGARSHSQEAKTALMNRAIAHALQEVEKKENNKKVYKHDLRY